MGGARADRPVVLGARRLCRRARQRAAVAPCHAILCTCTPSCVRRACESRGHGTVAINPARH
eukprot:8499527-Pyramimonas_sp.AAC.1